MFSESNSHNQSVAQNPVKVFIPAAEVFPGLVLDFDIFKSLLRSLSKTDVVFWLGRLNLIISASSDKSHFVRQEYGVKQFLSKDEIERVNSFAAKHGGASEIEIFFRGQILEMLRWVLLFSEDLPGDGETFEEPGVKRNFAKALLLSGDIWSKRVFGEEGERFSAGEGIDSTRRKALGAIRKGMEATSKAPDPYRSLGRGWLLFKEYLPTFHQNFEKEFQECSGITFDQYINCVAAMMTSVTDPERTSGLFNSNNVGEGTIYSEILKKYMQQQTQTMEELRDALWGTSSRESMNDFSEAPPYDYKPMREKPVMRSNDGRAIVIDPVFFGERISIGPLFVVAKDKSKKEANLLFTNFGHAFERYICDILKRIFPDPVPGQQTRLKCGEELTSPEIEVEIDALLNDVKKLVVFEAKAVFIPEESILGEESDEQYLEALKAKYSDNNKGVRQLARIIRVIANHKSNGCQEFSQVDMVYPVLIVHDPFLAAPVNGSILAEDFEQGLREDLSVDLPFAVRPLTIMTTEDLEDIEVSTRYFGIKELLEDYSRDCPDRMINLRNYISCSKYKDLMRHNKYLVETAMEIMKTSLKEVFGADVEAES